METSIRRGLPRAMVDDVFLAPVHINAGGTVYTTTLDTLTKYPESKLAKLFDGTLAISIDPISRQYFLDVNGRVFAHVLDFLRYGELLLPEDFTQLPLLTKLAESFEIKDMVQAMINIGGDESSGTEEEGSNVEKQQNKKCKNRKRLRTFNPCSASHENKNRSLEPENIGNDDAGEIGKMNIGTCELGIVKLGMLQGGRVDFGTVESAAMKIKQLESEMLTAKGTETEKLSTGNIESEVIQAKSTIVEVLKAEQLKSEAVEMDKVKTGNVEMQTVNADLTKVEMLEARELKSQTVEMEKVKTGNVEMETVNAGLTKVEMLETRDLKSQTVEMGKVNAEDFKVRRLEAESLKVKSLELETVSAAVASKCAETKSDGIGSNGSNFVIVQSWYNGLCLLASDCELQFNNIDSSFSKHGSNSNMNCWTISSNYSGITNPFGSINFFEPVLMDIIVYLSKNGYKLGSASCSSLNHYKHSEYILVK